MNIENEMKLQKQLEGETFDLKAETKTCIELDKCPQFKHHNQLLSTETEFKQISGLVGCA